jgi:hypothetical protein
LYFSGQINHLFLFIVGKVIFFLIFKLEDFFSPFWQILKKKKIYDSIFLNDTNILTFGFVTFIGLAYQGKGIVFRFIIEHSCLSDFGP